MRKICTKCGIEKELDEFYNAKSFKDGKTYSCKECMSTYRKIVSEKTKLYLRARRAEKPEVIKEGKRRYWSSLPPEKRMFTQARNRSRRKGIEFSISIEDISVPKECPILKVPFVIGKKNDYEFTPSIDRIDNSKGYVKGNIQVITKKANSMKNSASVDDLKKLAEWIIKTFN